MSALGRLVVSLALDHANFKDGLSKSEHEAKKAAANIERSFTTLKSGMATLGGLIGASGFTMLIKNSIDAADNLNDLSQQIGINVEQLAGYKLAAESSGTTLEGIAGASRKLSKAIAENDPLLAKLGITAKDADGAMVQLADVFAAIPDGAQKTALSMELMGKSGADMIPLLNGGGVALRAMIDDGRRLYPVTADMAKASDAFNDAMARMQIQAQGVGVQIANTILPGMNAMLARMDQAITLSSRHGGFVSLILNGVNPTGDIGRELRNVTKDIADAEEKVKRLKEGGASNYFLDGAQAQLDKYKAIKTTLQEIQRTQALALGAPYADYKIAKPTPPSLPSNLFTSNATSGKGPKNAGISAADWALEESAHLTKTLYEIQRQASEDYTEQLRQEFDAEWALIELQDDQFRAGRDAAQRWIDVIDPVERYRRELEEIDQLQESGLLSANQATQARFVINEQIDGLNKVGQEIQKNKSFAEEFGATFSSAVEDAIVNFKSLGDVARAVMEDITRMLVRRNVTDPLSKAISSFDFSTIFSAKGNVFNTPGLHAYANTVVTQPTIFPFARGVGLMGEAGAEAIMPLTRTASGELGVRSESGGGAVTVNVINNAPGAQSSQRTRQGADGGTIIDVVIEAARNAIASDITRGSGAVAAAMNRTYGLNRAAGAY